VITASHDRYFLDRICDKVFVFQDDHTWKEYPGGYSDYRRKVSQQKKTPVQKKDTRTKRIQTLSYYEKKELEKLPQIMEQLEKQLEQINEQIGQTSAYEQMIELSKRRDALDKRLEEATMRWMELEEKKEGQQNVS
jgi:ATP-binding cassette subfamily F protein uup